MTGQASTAPMSAGTSPAGPPEPAELPLTPGEALIKLFLDNVDNGRNAANDELIAALLQRSREIQALADLPGAGPGRMSNDPAATTGPAGGSTSEEYS